MAMPEMNLAINFNAFTDPGGQNRVTVTNPLA